MSDIFQPSPIRYTYVAGLENAISVFRRFDQFSGIIVDQALHSFVMPPNTIVQNGRRARIIAYGGTRRQFASVTLTVRVNSVVLASFVLPLVGIVDTIGWQISIDILRFNPTFYDLHIQCKDGYILGALDGIVTVRGVWQIITSNLTTESLLVEFLASVPNAGDMVEQSYTLGSVI